jgi:hypothetical protein
MRFQPRKTMGEIRSVSERVISKIDSADQWEVNGQKKEEENWEPAEPSTHYREVKKDDDDQKPPLKMVDGGAERSNLGEFWPSRPGPAQARGLVRVFSAPGGKACPRR